MLALQSNPRGVIVPVRAYAGARQNKILDIRAGMLRVAVTDAPEKGKANKAIAALLSRALGVSKSTVQLASGETSTRKRFLIVGGDVVALRATIAQLVGE